MTSAYNADGLSKHRAKFKIQHQFFMHFMQYQSLVATMQNDAAAMLSKGPFSYAWRSPGRVAIFGNFQLLYYCTAVDCGSVIYSLKSSFLQQFTITIQRCGDAAAQLFEAAFEPSLKGSRRRRRKTLVQQQQHKPERSWRQQNSILTAEASAPKSEKREREGRREEEAMLRKPTVCSVREMT